MMAGSTCPGLPAHYLPRPPMPLGAATIAAFEGLFVSSVARGGGARIHYELPVPKWQFLCYLADTKPIVLHGSGDPRIAEFEPRQSNDTEAFGNRRAVYAARDGLWPMYFAIVDRERYRMGLMNAAMRVMKPPEAAGSYYYFSIGGPDLPSDPWRSGTIYLLPDATFEQQQIEQWHNLGVESTQVASLVPVPPLARLAIEPDDFPFLQQIRRHDPATIRARALADPDGFPWLDV
jgi:hypothetical protein